MHAYLPIRVGVQKWKLSKAIDNMTLLLALHSLEFRFRNYCHVKSHRVIQEKRSNHLLPNFKETRIFYNQENA